MALVRNLQTGLSYATIGAAKDALPQPLDQNYSLVIEDSDTYLEPTIIFSDWQDAGFTLTIKAAAGQVPRMETTSSRCFWFRASSRIIVDGIDLAAFSRAAVELDGTGAGHATDCSDVVFRNLSVYGPSSSIVVPAFLADNNGAGADNAVENVTIEDCGRGVYWWGQVRPRIYNVRVTRMVGGTSSNPDYGVFLRDCIDVDVQRLEAGGIDAALGAGLYLRTCKGKTTVRNLLLYDCAGYTLFYHSCESGTLYHATLVGKTGGNYLLYLWLDTAASSLRVRNWILSWPDLANAAVYLGWGRNGTFGFDHTVWHRSAGTDPLVYDGQAVKQYATLAAWRAGTPSGRTHGDDAKSIEGDPLFVAAGANDYRLQTVPPSPAVDLGETGLGIAEDLDGRARPIGLPDAGAYESGAASAEQIQPTSVASSTVVGTPTLELRLGTIAIPSGAVVGAPAVSVIAPPLPPAELDAFRSRLGAGQGRIEPSGASPASGDYSLVLGEDEAGRIFELVAGDHAEVVQTTDVTNIDLIRAQLRLRVPDGTPANLGWEVSMIVDGVKHGRATCRRGRARKITDLAANVSKLAGVHRVGVRLELVGA